MALDKKTFRTRTLTAIVFAVVMLIGLFTNVWAFFALFFTIMVGCVVEFVRLVFRFKPSLLFFSVLYNVLPILLIIDLGVDRSLFASGERGNAYVTEVFTPLFPCAIIFSIWINDTMAYIVGSLIGKTPFSKISPKKTWEGTIGGAILCVIVIGLLGIFVPVASHIPVQNWVAIAAICAVFGTLGDLLESKIKRLANVKDSGSFMPGHGGFLDRFDSLLIATPAVWLYIKFFM
ncbi:MAG: phosphatidate cytidylyltransferase [Gloeobacteraceae cyanobacterium ES-bin-316]|nr:phosphatidate cytidylyltransferase [Ferruginibacter sp.]